MNKSVFWGAFEKRSQVLGGVELYKPKPSTRPGKKYMVYVKGENGNPKLIHFGATGYQHNYSEEAKKNFRARHNCTNASKDTAKWWACNYLWGEDQKIGTKTNRSLVKNAEELRKEVSTVAVMHNGKMLMGKRRDNGKWTAPGGHLEKGEKPLDGAVRELYEESGIEADPKDLKFIRTIKNPENGYVVHGYRYDIDEKAATSMKQDPDGEVYRWYYKNTKDIPDSELHVPRAQGNVLLPELEKSAFARGFEKAASHSLAVRKLMKKIEQIIPELPRNNNLIDYTHKKYQERKEK